jgi:hypothetical protein
MVAPFKAHWAAHFSNHFDKGKAMTQTARILSAIEYREGDGAALEIREGPVELEITEIDVTISWSDEDTHSATAIPMGDFQRHVTAGRIELDAPEAVQA